MVSRDNFTFSELEQWLDDNHVTEIECLVPDLTGVAPGQIMTPAKFTQKPRMRLPEAGVAMGVRFRGPVTADKKRGPKRADVMYDKGWPVRQPCLLFAGVALDKPEYIALWRRLDADPTVEEVLRNWPVRQPVLWV